MSGTRVFVAIALVTGLVACGSNDTTDGYTDAEIQVIVDDAFSCGHMATRYSDALSELTAGANLSVELMGLRMAAINASAAADSSDLISAFMDVPSNQEETETALLAWGDAMLASCEGPVAAGVELGEWIEETGWDGEVSYPVFD